MNTSADDCSLTYAGITLYGALDAGYGYSTHGAPGNPSAGYLNYTILRSSGNAHWLWSPNALGTSVIGLKMKEDLGYGWSLIGVVEAALDPYSGMLINAPRSRTDNNVNPFASQTVNFDSSRAGQWDNSQGYIGLSNPAYGTLTFGRTNSLSLDVLAAYDPVASAAFSLIGFSSCVSSEGWHVQQEKGLPGQESKPRSLDSRVAGNQNSEAYRQRLPRGDDEPPGRNESKRECGLENA